MQFMQTPTPKRRAEMAVLPAIILSLFLISHQALSIDEKHETVMEWGEPVMGLVLSVHVPNPTPSVEEPVVVNVAIKNVSNELIRVFETGNDYTFTVLNGAGDPVPKLAYQHLLDSNRGHYMGLLLGVAPGDSREIKVNLSRRFDFSMPGHYSVQVERKLGGTEGPVSLMSNSLSFKLQ